jgi:hypothetical protein
MNSPLTLVMPVRMYQLDSSYADSAKYDISELLKPWSLKSQFGYSRIKTPRT